MKAQNVINMVRRYTEQYGVKIAWHETEAGTNSRGRTVKRAGSVEKTAAVIVLKEKYSPLKPIQTSIGLSQDYARYILALPDIELKRGAVITDNRGMKWKLGIIDWFDIGGAPVAQQAALTEVS